jgi:hypothetical protein
MVDWQVPAVVTVGQQRGSLSQLFSFDAPAPLLGLPGEMPPRATGNRIATVFGDRFSAWDVTPAVWIGGTLCAPSFWTSDSSLSVRFQVEASESSGVAAAQASFFPRSRLRQFSELCGPICRCKGRC